MPAYKDKKTGLWKALFYYTNYKNERKKKQKRGFETKKLAQEWEREFLLKSQFSLEMNFDSLYSLYYKDMESRIKISTLSTKQYIVNKKILPYFGKMKIQDIKAVHIRNWQSELLKTNYSKTYIRTINNQLTAIFNYAVRFHNLSKNPCHIAGSIGKKDAEEMSIINVEDFNRMINFVSDEENRCFYKILFWTGLRKGELLALTYKDVDFDKKTININKNFQVIESEEIISDPKTPKSKRTISVNNIVLDSIKKMWDTCYKPTKDLRIFYLSKYSIKRQLDTACKKAKIPCIRVHDLRHSHASYLLSNGIDVVSVSRRLGHEKVQTTLNVYCHISLASEEKLNALLDV